MTSCETYLSIVSLFVKKMSMEKNIWSIVRRVVFSSHIMIRPWNFRNISHVRFFHHPSPVSRFFFPPRTEPQKFIPLGSRPCKFSTPLPRFRAKVWSSCGAPIRNRIRPYVTPFAESGPDNASSSGHRTFRISHSGSIILDSFLRMTIDKLLVFVFLEILNDMNLQK